MPQNDIRSQLGPSSSITYSYPQILTSINSVGGTSGTWPTANRAYFYPIRLPKPVLVKQLFWENGAAVSGNVDCGIYDEHGTLIVSTGSTAQSGTSTTQVVDITDKWIGPGVFYVGLVIDNTTGTVIRNATAERNLTQFGWMYAASAFPLPATITFATHGSNNFRPEYFGLTIEGTF